MKKYRIIIPSWAQLSAEMQAETGCLYPAFVQLGGQPLYVHIIKSYEAIKKDSEFIIVLNENSAEVQHKYINDFDVRTVRLKGSESIGQTVLAAMNGLATEQAVVVHMADTLTAPLDSSFIDNVLFVQLRSDIYRWTSVRKEDSGEIRVVTDRDHLSAGIEETVCVGVFQLSNGIQFSSCLKTALAEPKLSMDPFFKAIEFYSKQYSLELKNMPSWHDFGHVDSYYESRLSHQNLRHFNTLNYDSERGLVTKRSINVEAYRHQIRWFRQVPDELAWFLPRIYESDDGEVPYITMELLSYPTVSDLFLSKRMDVGAWNYVAKKILLIQKSFLKYQFKCSIGRQVAAEIYIEKTRKRILDFYNQRPEAKSYWIKQLDTKISLDDVLATLENYATYNGLLILDALSPIHGDMCFSNLMYDPRSRHIKLIDPRGEFGVPGIYGDPKYDKAKLMHSYEGAYDFIVTGHYDASVTKDGELDCSIERSEYHEQVAKIFDSIVFSSENERKQCDAIQALLFLSMLPLHCDHPERQLAMLYIGLKIYVRNFDDFKKF
jgi:hypothetical protein